ncbi:MAG: tRNA threonylcarbamoyladenosine dehydratase [Bacteroidales bacterium]|nr:tRNA threonylcarbamoyladenosine dehydratase [Clostridium sp.]MCM1203554.1 tRNA threonylcarbamoyladenosine dehydratase [Bacteroidales bacterium]
MPEKMREAASEDFLSRTRGLIGEEGLNTLKRARILVFGVGGVGGHAVEALVRSGVGRVDICDKDAVSESNCNRQIIADRGTVGLPKVEVMKARALSINPDIQMNTFSCFYLPETADIFDFSGYDYIIDAIDNVTAKLSLIEQAKAAGTEIICSMGTGNKLHPELFRIADIEETSVCPLARVIRKELKKRDIHGVKVLYSKEKPVVRQQIPASISFVPGAAGLMIAGEVIRELLRID